MLLCVELEATKEHESTVVLMVPVFLPLSLSYYCKVTGWIGGLVAGSCVFSELGTHTTDREKPHSVSARVV